MPGGSFELTQTMKHTIIASLHSFFFFVSQLKMFWFFYVLTLVPLLLLNHKLMTSLFKHPFWQYLNNINSFWRHHRGMILTTFFLQNILNLCKAEKVILVLTLINKGYIWSMYAGSGNLQALNWFTQAKRFLYLVGGGGRGEGRGGGISI